ncbi:MAG: hypothetical protein F2554_01575 [Actinobacteria bacterium]|uniref:Unannotated protein n=1 Tax=freshwater metagenome TaxID=449393 RepID=A0A6J6DGI9_9ZZZZ|nr:hypothetical protein [Actinomycetota bacterium]
MLKVDGERIRYDLSWIENLGAFARDPVASLANLSAVSRREHPWTSEVLRGVRAPGTGFPFLIMLGTMRRLRGKDFCVIYRRNPVLVLEFKGEKFERWIIPASAENIELLGAKGFTV